MGTGKGLDLDLTGTALKPFFGLCQGAKHVNYSAFTNFGLEKTCRSVAKTA